MGKIYNLEQLKYIYENFRHKISGNIVQAHGVFDLLHPGHLRHLQAAKRAAGNNGALIVSITSDRHVNKGPGRPVFSENVRAEVLAALECVDAVVICDSPSGVPVIEAIKPNIFFKGKEYADKGQDVTGKIVIEKKAVEANGGVVQFTDEMVFSSSTLINKHLDIYEPELGRYLETMRADGGLLRLLDAIEKMSKLRVCLIGESIIDEYTYATALGKAGKENLVAMRFDSHDIYQGGVLATAKHLANFCKFVEVVTAVGNDNYAVQGHIAPNMHINTVTNVNRPTIRKSRVIDSYSNRKLSELYYINDTPLPRLWRDSFNMKVANVICGSFPKWDLVMVNDFGHDLIDQALIGFIRAHADFLAANAQTNAGNYGYNPITRYASADFACVDESEARLAAMNKHGELSTVTYGLKMFEKLIITRGKHGSISAEFGKLNDHVPALTNSTVDTMGAGDAFFAIAAPLVKLGVLLRDVCFLGNAAGALKANILGHKGSVEKPALIKFITALLK